MFEGSMLFNSAIFTGLFCDELTSVVNTNVTYRYLSTEAEFTPGVDDIITVNDTVALYQCINGATHVGGSLNHYCVAGHTWTSQHGPPLCEGVWYNQWFPCIIFTFALHLW